MSLDLALDRRDAWRELAAFPTVAPIVVYVLHVEPPCGHGRHYIGSVAAHRVRRRLQAHANGYGANFTRAAVRAGARLYLVRLFEAESRWLETMLLRQGDPAGECCLCEISLAPPPYAGRLAPTAPPPGAGGLEVLALP